ncbi:MAG: twin-arginine translocase TatA/TatE family subunit [Candidatus Acididesulfobacter diazotrophicus]|jgi:sec-independent protein translocase protein TatA|uniref:Sec-independent protein translocase protein TatA n=1 Tax=Candidatus Acididesulfobacter diazotrophicus TaxID=2597226 RepID=A0A519BMA6_9DELT|nr:MAG: twin-arginine translocase TatA/TatE family subunit [Candidatus Acididesulfobacter diazotrophicus]
MFGFSPIIIFVLLLIVVLIFGVGKLPELGSGIGKAIKNFKRGASGKDEIDVTPEPAKHQIKKISAAPRKSTRKTTSKKNSAKRNVKVKVKKA